MTDVADTEQLLRLIQSIPSPKAEPFKMWLAAVGRERIEETIDPELTIDRALAFGCVFGGFLPCMDFFVPEDINTLPPYVSPLIGGIFPEKRAFFIQFFASIS